MYKYISVFIAARHQGSRVLTLVRGRTVSAADEAALEAELAELQACDVPLGTLCVYSTK